MARGTDGTTEPAFGKPVRLPGGERPAPRAARGVQIRRLPRVVESSVQFLKDVRAEMNRVAWPDRQHVIASSLVVIFVLVVTALYLAGWDLVFAKLFEPILRR